MNTVAFPAKKAFLYSLVASVVLAALLGIVAILSGRFGWFEIRVILTTAVIACASVCGLACGAYLGTKSGSILPLAGLALTLLAAAMLILGMWIEFDSIVYWKLAAAACVFAVALAHLSLLSMARLARWFQWSLTTAYVVILGVATLISVMIFWEFEAIGMFRLLAVAAIVDAAITVLVPIFHRLSKKELLDHSNDDSATALIDAEIAALRQKIEQLEQRRAALQKS